MWKKSIIIIGFFLIPIFAFSHPGRTDSNGGHNGPNGYHYHNGTSNTGTNRTQNNNQVSESDEYKKYIILTILNSEDSVADVRDMDGDLLGDLSRYAAIGPTTLSMADRTVFTFLVQTEFDRRDMNPENFGRYLQRQNNDLQSRIANGGDVNIYRRQQNIIQAFISRI